MDNRDNRGSGIGSSWGSNRGSGIGSSWGRGVGSSWGWSIGSNRGGNSWGSGIGSSRGSRDNRDNRGGDRVSTTSSGGLSCNGIRGKRQAVALAVAVSEVSVLPLGVGAAVSILGAALGTGGAASWPLEML